MVVLNQDQVLVRDPAFPTRCGTSSTRDTTPDLIFGRNVVEVKRSNLNVDFGSDHHLLTYVLQIGQARPRKFRVTDWNLFHKVREESSEDEEKLYLELWTAPIRDNILATAKKGTTGLPVKKMGCRVVHLLKAKQSLLAKWKGQGLNGGLRKKITEGRPLEHLLEDTNTELNQRCTPTRTLYAIKQESSDNQVLAEVYGKYLPIASVPPPPAPIYQRGANPVLDAGFGSEEIRHALHDLNGRSAPGPDNITNRALRNLCDRSVVYVMDIVNQVCKSGGVPEMWKTTTTILNPKPGKSHSLGNFMPIHLTSCIGKVAEHAILNRVTRYLEESDIYLHNMISFRAGLSMQDAMKLSKYQVVDTNTRDIRAIPGLHLERAFENVLQQFVLSQI
nr:uncharacterized protein LOC119187224 [Rhipicephalus microplus]